MSSGLWRRLSARAELTLANPAIRGGIIIGKAIFRSASAVSGPATQLHRIADMARDVAGREQASRLAEKVASGGHALQYRAV